MSHRNVLLNIRPYLSSHYPYDSGKVKIVKKGKDIHFYAKNKVKIERYITRSDDN
ncbi:MAG: hypothetical protein K9L17_05535 [Clostridiales bacterium]|nr:hypothetical protein [Clostridiales bacterium]